MHKPNTAVALEYCSTDISQTHLSKLLRNRSIWHILSQLYIVSTTTYMPIQLVTSLGATNQFNSIQFIKNNNVTTSPPLLPSPKILLYQCEYRLKTNASLARHLAPYQLTLDRCIITKQNVKHPACQKYKCLHIPPSMHLIRLIGYLLSHSCPLEQYQCLVE